jgi:hypothetical protein
MPNTSQISPTVVSCFGGLILNKDVFSMRPGEALALQNFEKFNFDGNDKIIIATGSAAAFTLNTSYTEDIINATGGGTAPTNPRYVKSFANHMWYAGMSNATSTLQFSGPYTEDDFDTGGGSIIIGDVITGMKVFRDTLFVFCEDSIFKITGTSSSDFAKAEVAKDVGTLSHHSIQELGGDLKPIQKLVHWDLNTRI